MAQAVVRLSNAVLLNSSFSIRNRNVVYLGGSLNCVMSLGLGNGSANVGLRTPLLSHSAAGMSSSSSLTGSFPVSPIAGGSSSRVRSSASVDAAGQTVDDPPVLSPEPDAAFPEGVSAPQGHLPNPYANLDISRKWEDIQGANDWKGLLAPLDEGLRGEIIRYGEFCQVIYESFDFDVFSMYRGSCKYSRQNFFKCNDMENRGYEVTAYIYATSDLPMPKFFLKKVTGSPDDNWDKYSNWIAYVAVCTSEEELKRLGRRDIIVSWRGTLSNLEWIENVRLDLRATGQSNFRVESGTGEVKKDAIKVERGFLSMYESAIPTSKFNKDSARTQVSNALRKLMETYKDDKWPLSITMIGHSLGAALAVLSAYDIAEQGINYTYPSAGNGAAGTEKVRVPVTVYTYGGPRVGNGAFCDRVNELKVKILRVLNIHDVVGRVPGLFINENTTRFFWFSKWMQSFIDNLPDAYQHVGTEFSVNTYLSPFLLPSRKTGDAHNLEVYLHTVDGFVAEIDAKGKVTPGFSEKIFKRDIALVNKSANMAKHPYFLVPPLWLQDKNKGLIKDASGKFFPRGRDTDNIPQPY